jgi:hypothetical protein
MARPRPPIPPVKLPLLDYEGWAARLVAVVREGQTFEGVFASVEAYAIEVRNVECAHEAARVMGQDAELIRKNCPTPLALITRWQEDAERDFGPGREFTDRKLARFLAAMYRDVRAAQFAEAVREAGSQAAAAEAVQDSQRVSKWRRVEANLGAAWQSICSGGFVPVPGPRE